MSYLLEQSAEFSRLQQQNADPEFDPNFDLNQFEFTSPQSILDLGCGSGVMTYLFHHRFPEAEVVGVDASEIRVKQLMHQHKGNSKIQFKHAYGNKLPFKEGHFDTILMRYVAQHISTQTLVETFKEALRCLKTNGNLLVVDVDGYLETLHPMGELTRKTLDLLSSSGVLDFKVGRKLPSLLNSAGFESVDWKMDAVSFQREARIRGIQRTLERVDGSKQGLFQMGYSEAEFERLRSEIHASLTSPYSVCYLNRFYITAKKGGSISLAPVFRKE